MFLFGRKNRDAQGPNPPEDDALLRRFCAGDRGAFDEIFRRHAPRVHATAYRLTGQWEDAEDAIQEVFLRLAAKAPTIRRGAALSSWLYRTTLNCAADRLRLRGSSYSLDASEPAAARIIAIESMRREACALERRHNESLLQRVEALIPRLPERQGAVFVLRFFQGLPHREIAAILEITETGSKSLHCLACRRLRDWAAQGDAAESPQGARLLEDAP